MSKAWDPRAELASLRWHADMAVITAMGEHVWLKQIEHGLTDCCYIDTPCERHAPMSRPACTIAGCLHSESDYDQAQKGSEK